MKKVLRGIYLLLLALFIALGMLSACTPQTAKTYRTVTFDTQGGTAIKSARVEDGKPLTPPEQPEREGYTFAYWAYEGEKYNFSTILTKNIKLVAVYTPISYTIEYSLEGGTLSADAPTKYTIESEDFVLAEPVREGYVFLGWQSKEADAPAKSVTVKKGSTGNLSFTAIWSDSLREVSFAGDGVSLPSLTLSKGEKIPAPSLTRNGYRLIGWYHGEDAWDFDTMTLEENITLVAEWECISYPITYKLDGATLDKAPTAYTIETESFTLPAPTKTGYDFIGWTSAQGTTPSAELTVAKGSFGDLVFTAHFTPKRFTAAFTTDGTPVAPVTQDYNTKLVAPESEKIGYTLLGWFLGEDEWDFESDTLTEDITLVAKWKINTYTVTFTTDGSPVAPVTQDYNTKLVAPESEKVGYTLLGWFLGEDEWDFENDTLTEDITLVATWSINTYTVAFDTAGGSSVNAYRGEYGTLVSEPTAPTKTAYIFAGWTYMGEAWSFDLDTIEEDMTLVAAWTPVSYTISYELNGGALSQPITSYTIEAPTFTLPTPTRKNYNFIGWTYEGQDTPVLTVTIEKGSMGNLHFVANFEIKRFTVTFDAQGGSAVASVTQDYGTYVAQPESSREGYTLKYWTANGISAYSFETTRLTGNITLTAVWAINQYTVTYDAAGGMAVPSVKQDHGSKLTEPETTKTGSVFVGWYLGEEEWDFENDILTEDITLTAKWEIAYYTVTFDARGGSAVESVELKCGDTVGSTPTSERDGYRFLGWLLDGEPFDCTSTPVSDNITLYASWAPIEYTIEYKLGDASIEGAPYTYTVESESFTLPAPTLLYHRFLGWTYEGQTTPVLSVSVENGTKGNLSFTACFEIIRCQITFDEQGGSEVADVTQNAGTTLTNPQSEKRGYRFLGWYLGDAPWSFDTLLTESMMLTARWELIEYTITYNLDGGTIIGAPKSFTVQSDTITLPTPTKAHYLFLGWTYEGQSTPVGTVTIAAGEIGDRTYTANFRLQTHKVTFITNAAGTMSPITVDYGSKLTEPEVVKEGYTLVGWYHGENAWDFENDTVESDMILSAVWNENVFKITFIYGNQRSTVYVSRGEIPTEPEDIRYYNGMHFVCWNAYITSASADTVYEAIYTDIMSTDDMLEMYGKSLLDFSKSNLLDKATALYLLALQEHESPLDGPVRERVLEHLRTVVQENRAPDFNLAPSWQHTMLTAAVALARNTPSIWKHVDSELEERLDVMMKAFAYMASIGTSDYNNYKTGPSMLGNYDKGWNPNYRMANIPAIIYATSYFGNNNFTSGATTMNSILKGFDEDEYNFMISKFEEYGWKTALSYWTTEGKVCDDGTSYHGKVGADAKTMLISGGPVVCDDTPRATTIWVDGGTGVGVNNGGRDYLYQTIPLSNPAGIVEALLDHNYKGGAVKSDHYYDINGDGVKERVAWIVDNSISPYQGQIGMMTEFASNNRSSTSYCSHDFMLSTVILSSAKALGFYDIKQDNSALWEKVIVGNEDFLYKNERGYQGYSTGSYGTSTKIHSEANEGTSYFALKTYWRECMKGSEEGYFPVLPY